MKICKKMPEPASLDAYRSAQPEGTWDQMRDDPYHGGQPAYRDIKSTLVKAQRCLCAYCEIRIADGTSDTEIGAKSHDQRVFHFAPNGRPEPHAENCASHTLPNNRYPDTATLVARTIEHLNLGCMRLNHCRCIVKARLEKQIRKAREDSPGASPEEVLLGLARRLFSTHVDSPWPRFFTLIRSRPGEHAEAHLRSIPFTG